MHTFFQKVSLQDREWKQIFVMAVEMHTYREDLKYEDNLKYDDIQTQIWRRPQFYQTKPILPKQTYQT